MCFRPPGVKKVNEPCPECGTLKDTIAVCPKCGFVPEAECPKCKTKNPVTADACCNCGYKAPKAPPPPGQSMGGTAPKMPPPPPGQSMRGGAPKMPPPPPGQSGGMTQPKAPPAPPKMPPPPKKPGG